MMTRTHLLLTLWSLLTLAPQPGLSTLEPGIWGIVDLSKENNYVGAVKNVYAGTKVNIR